MPRYILSPAIYLIVLMILLGLTVLTMAISFVPLQGFLHVLVGETIALAKATLVVIFFMHVIFSPRVTWIVVTVTVFWLVVVFISLTLSDYLTRGWSP